MKEIKRRLMNNYVEMQDGTFAKEVNGELRPVHEDEAYAFQDEMDDVFQSIDWDYEEGITVDDHLDYLNDGTDEETRRLAYFRIAGGPCPKGWHVVLSATVRFVDDYYGNHRIQNLVTNLMPQDLAWEKFFELGVTANAHLRVCKLLAAMQRDLEAGTNLDVVDFLLNDWEEWGSCPGSSMWDYEDAENHFSNKGGTEDMEIEDMEDDLPYWGEPEIMDEDMAYWYERGCPENDCPGFRGD